MPMNKPARYLVLIESGEGMVARLFDAERRPLGEFDASSFEVAEMTRSTVPSVGIDPAAWGSVLGGHNAQQQNAARVYTLDP